MATPAVLEFTPAARELLLLWNRAVSFWNLRTTRPYGLGDFEVARFQWISQWGGRVGGPDDVSEGR